MTREELVQLCRNKDVMIETCIQSLKDKNKKMLCKKAHKEKACNYQQQKQRAYKRTQAVYKERGSIGNSVLRNKSYTPYKCGNT